MEKTLEQSDFETSAIIQNSFQIQFPYYKTLQIDTTDVEKDVFLIHLFGFLGALVAGNNNFLEPSVLMRKSPKFISLMFLVLFNGAQHSPLMF